MTRNTKLLIWSIFIVTVGIFAALAFVKYNNYQQSFYDISFDIKNSDITSLEIHNPNNNNELIGSIEASSSKTRLRWGDYTVVARGNNISDKPLSFSVPSEKPVIVDPDFSESYLASLLDKERDSIHQVIKNNYPQVDNFAYREEFLLKKGEWFGGVLVQRNTEQVDVADEYKVIVRKVDGNWVVQTKPSLVLSYSDYPDIPKDIIDTLNL